jgi:hypothetical protein
MRTIVFLLIVSCPIAMSSQSKNSDRSESVKPPFTLSISCAPAVGVGSPIEVRVRLTNTSSRDMNGSTGEVRGFSGAYLYDIRDESGNVLQQKKIDPTHQGSGRIIVLKPGQSRDDVTNLSEAYDLWPGKYTIQLSLPIPGDPKGNVVKSNITTATVTP